MLKILDLFCGAGGAAMGLHRAIPDADITGVDIVDQPRYPFRFVKADAVTVPLDGYDLIWASPPCQAYSLGARRWNKEWPDLVAPTRARLLQWGGSWIIENVPLAPLVSPIVLCGQMFGLRVIRHRLFESNFSLTPPPHPPHTGSVKAGDYVTCAGHGGNGSNAFAVWQEAMQIDWMTKKEIAQAVPPAYSQYLAYQWLAHRMLRRAA